MTCSTCKGQCPAPTACHQPDPTPAPRMFRPTFGLDGPHRRRPGRIRRALRALFSSFLNR